jgi:hypothetical protein
VCGAQVPTGFEVLSLVVLTAGVVLSIWEGSLSGSTTGISIAVTSTFCGAAMLNFSGKVWALSMHAWMRICAVMLLLEIVSKQTVKVLL